ncbi:TRAP transporter large permease [Peptoniphilus sp. KCTC 25270]|uniref:TRAP transporter large permease n=1 Tax=Peptoniphilus sp. KCTC 25270 TaxID=2897414 RepID=UPI001E42E087|nr:TRAP transporter large permease [Peptoniphilus sp. KCTC 25270]MCD1146635.1 TRAP transporter large permease [Peptoniphilus sp. KCTC 25270]
MLILLFILLAVFVSISLPIGISLGLSTLLAVILTTNIDSAMIAQTAFTGLDSFTLMAIPFFMLAGNFMRYGGISKRLLHLADTLVGHMTGGMGAVTTLTSMFFAAISGSGPATVSAIGGFMIPEMEARGYDRGYSGALAAATGTIGVVIPPSIPFVIYGVVTNTSIGDMFKAGILPGILMGVAIMVYNYIVSNKFGWKGNTEKASFGDVVAAFKEGFWALLSPIIILGGIYSGYFTPTEAAAISCVYTWFIGTFIYKEIGKKELYDCLNDTFMIAGATSFLIGLSAGFAFLLTMEQVPGTVANMILGFSENKIVILLLINVFLLVVGMFIDNISSCTILAPIFLPVVVALGVNPIHFGIIMTINLAIGFITPPYGANLFIASAISNQSMDRIAKWIWGLIAIIIAVLLLVTFVPQLSLMLV